MKVAVFLLVWTVALVKGNTGEIIYFLVGDRPGDSVRNESFVLPLSNREDIDYARYLISRIRAGFFLEGDRPIVVADVVAARDDINRNYLDPKFPKWSWQVGEFISFAEIVAEGIIFSPTALEQMDWSHPSARTMTVAFEGIFVIRELGPVPLYSSITPAGENLECYWSAAGSNYVYTLEGNESLSRSNWFPVPGAAWPLKTNHWTLPLTNTTTRFYRVRAEQSNQ